MDLTTRKRRPSWMTPFGGEGWGDAWMDRLWPEWARWQGGEVRMNMNVSEKEGKYVLNAELPGIDKDNLSISIDNNVVTITGKKEESKEEQGATFYLKESTYGAFSRSIRLPSEVDEDKVEASFKDGVLKLIMPHKEEQKKRRIEIKAE